MVYKNLLLETKDGIAKLMVNRPKVLNALNPEVLEELWRFFTEIQSDKSEVKGVILTGAGDKAFVAGADIATMRTMTALDADKFCALGHDTMRAIETSRVPVIAAVNGFALGGGFELALACDFIYASTSAAFGLPEVGLGLFPGFGGTQRLSRLIGRARAKELIFTGDLVKAELAARVGIVNRLFEPDQLIPESENTLKKILNKGPVAVRLAKRVINEGADLPLASGLMLEQTQFPLVFATEDRVEGVSAFLDKKKPEFKGR